MKPDYQREGITLYNADCLDVLPTLDPGSVDAVITDPPYSSGGQYRGDRTAKALTKYVRSETQWQYQNFGGDNRDQRSFLAWCSLWLCASFHASTPGAALCCFSDWRQLPVMTDAIQAGGWTWRNLATWWKPGCRMQRGRFSSSAEYILYATAGPNDGDGEKSPQNVFQYATLKTDDKEHIAEKPVAVVAWTLGVSRPDAVVLDPFAGSGTTAIACIRNGRKFVGVEIDKTYFDIAVARIERELNQPRLPGM